MADNKLITLINKLIEKTNEGSLDWEVTDKEEEFQLPFSDYTIRLSFSESPSNNLDVAYYIKIFNSAGQLIDSYNDEDVKDSIENSFHKFRDLHSSARRKALGVDKAIDDILSALDLPF